MFIRSERLFLRPGWPEEWAEVLAAIGDEAVVRNLARAPWPYTAKDARDFLDHPQQRMLPNLFATLPTADGARLIGGVSLMRDAGEVELGYWIAPAHWGQGFATEAARAVISQARALGHRRIVASHFVDNPASGRVLAKLGFCPTGDKRLRYSAGRRGVAMSLGYELSLDTTRDCNDDFTAAMWAA